MTTKRTLASLLVVAGACLVVVGLIIPLIGFELPSLQSGPTNYVKCMVHVKFTDGNPVEGAAIIFGSYPYPTTKFTDSSGFCWEYLCDEANGDVYGIVKAQYGSYISSQVVSGEPGSTVQVLFNDVPTGTSPGDTGTLVVQTFDGSTQLTLSVSVTFPDGHTEDVVTPKILTSAATGEYTVSGIYLDETITKTGVVSAQEVTHINLRWGVIDPMMFLNVASLSGLVCVVIGILVRFL